MPVSEKKSSSSKLSIEDIFEQIKLKDFANEINLYQNNMDQDFLES